MRTITTNRGVELLVPEKGEKHPNAGRPKGAKNVMTRVLKDAIVLAAAESQHAKDNGGGLVGYLTYIADTRPDIFARLLAKLLPLQEKERARTAKQPDKPVGPAAYRAAAKVRAAPIVRGVPVRKVDRTMGTQSSNVIDGPFKRQDADDTDDDVA
jgi:hypothetical protein